MITNNIRWIFLGLCVLGLISVRFVEDHLFYDPILIFFKDETIPFPTIEWGNIILHHIFRFSLNLLFSLGIIYFAFLNKEWTLQAGILIIASFLIFFPIYLYCLYSEFDFGRLFGFYIRRMVIQPIPLLIILPLFYYRLLTSK